MSDAANPVGNFFNGTISDNGENVTGRIPALDQPARVRPRPPRSSPRGRSPTARTAPRSASARSGTPTSSAGIAFDTLIRAPNGKIAKSVTPTHGRIPGDVVTYTTTVSNPQRPEGETPTDADWSARSPRTRCRPGSTSPASPSTRARACSYDDATRTITCTDRHGSSPTAPSPIAYRATVNAAAQGTTPAKETNTACYRARSEDQPDAEFYGCDDADGGRAAEPLRRSRRGQDRVGRDRGAGRDTDLDDHGHQPRSRRLDRVRPSRTQLPPGVGFVSATAEPAARMHDARRSASSGDVVCTRADRARRARRGLGAARDDLRHRAARARANGTTAAERRRPSAATSRSRSRIRIRTATTPRPASSPKSPSRRRHRRSRSPTAPSSRRCRPREACSAGRWRGRG